MDKNLTDVELTSIRKRFYALRNGMIADTLRKGGLEQKYIFGLQLPQIKEIAAEFRPADDLKAAEMGRKLWEDKNCREARLLACHIMPSAMMTPEEAQEWAEGVATREEADILAFRLLRYANGIGMIAERLEKSDSALERYTATAIRRFL